MRCSAALEKKPKFVKASAYSGDVVHLPVKSIDDASQWYASTFAMKEVKRSDTPVRNVVLERDGVRIGFSENGGDSSQNGAAIVVSGIEALRQELEASGATVGNWRIDQRDGDKYQVFFVVAPDGLCYYFHECLSA